MSKPGFGRMSSGEASPQEVYAGLRSQALACTAQLAGVNPDGDPVFGVLADVALSSGGVTTIVALADGTTSMYTSSGGGILGGGAHARVAAASRFLISQAAAHRALFSPGWKDGPLNPGEIRLIALAPSGSLAAVDRAANLVSGRAPLSSVFMAVNDVITQLRMITPHRGEA